MNRHTPGPWSYKPHNTDPNFMVINCGEHESTGLLRGYCGEHNARLIVASPDLLAACEMFMYSVQHTEIKGEPGSLLEVMRDAIEKATGGEA